MKFFLLRTTGLALSVVFLICCNRNPYAVTNRQYKKQVKSLVRDIQKNPAEQTMSTAGVWVGTTNFNLRKPNIVVIHHTAQDSCAQTLRTFTLMRTQVSAHYVICRDGLVHHMLNDYLRAWHAGSGRWGNISDVNSSSIGIELDNNGFEPFSEAQITSLEVLLDTLKKRYAIPAYNFIGHADMAPTRKNDPNVQFPWQRIAEKGFGIWWTDTTAVAVPDNFDPYSALRVIGYDLRDTSAVVNTFRRKFLQQEVKDSLNSAEIKVLYSLYRKFLQ